jgi:NCAIR mutase (PurE)-related protein
MPRGISMCSRFVVQEHTTPDGVHWDLMLEKGEVLTTFRLEQPPEAASASTVRATKIFDHPLRFLMYEGPVQKGTGKVRIVERGTCDVPVEGEDVIALRLQGTTLQGDFTLTRIKGASWQLALRC